MRGESGVVRLLTLNALFKGDVPARLRALGAILERADYDVVCLQEVMFRHHVRLLHAAARSYGHRVVAGTGAVRGGLVILSRRPVRRARFIRYPIRRPLRPELLMCKGAQVAYLDVAGGELAVVNTHLSANRDGDWSAGNRYTRVERAELDRLAELVNGVDPAVPLVAVGDFNVPRNAPDLARFRAAAGLTDVLAGSAEPTYRPTAEYPSPPAFDHVLVRATPGGELTASARLVFQAPVRLGDGRRAYLSDHYGIEAELRPRWR